MARSVDNDLLYIDSSFMNKTDSVGLSPTMQKYIDKKMLALAETKFVHQQFGQKRPIPRNQGKTVVFRKYNLFNVDTKTLKLTEGVTPDAQLLSQTSIEATVEQYGAYVVITDLLDLTALDPLISDAAKLLGEQLGTLIDWLTRDAMLAGASAQYAGGNSDEQSLDASDVMTIAEVRQAVKTLKKAKARPFGDGTFVCIVDPDVEYDLMNDSLWKDLAVHADPKRMVRGEIGTLFGVKFVESTEGKIGMPIVQGSVNADTSASTTFVIKEYADLSEEAIEYLSTATNKLNINGNEHTIASYAEATGTVTLSSAASLTAGQKVFSLDAGAIIGGEPLPIHHSLVFGDEAYGVIDVAGSGAIKSIIERAGGVSDPLHQRNTVAGKVMGYVAKVLNSNWIIDIMSAAS